MGSTMRYLLLALCALMVLFAVVQYNDPDGLWWGAIYMIPAIFAAVAALWPATLGSGAGRISIMAAIAAAIVGMVHYWPQTTEFWRVDVWWHTETAREGMGMMIVLVVLAISYFAARARSQVR